MLHANASFASVRALVRLNTGEFLNALRLNDEIRRGVPRTFPACSTRVCFGTSQSAFFRNNYHRTFTDNKKSPVYTPNPVKNPLTMIPCGVTMMAQEILRELFY